MAEIILDNVSLDFPIYGANTRSLKKRILRATTGGLIKQNDSDVITVRALQNVNLHIEHGDRVGIIGHNGAGKSTLLRVISGIYEPIVGQVKITGKITSLLNMMLGLDPESTGLENIKICGILNQMTYAEIQQKTQDIADFTDLGGYLAMPTRTYSNGMQLRLAFAIATSIDPEILVLDEIVNVGDAKFLEKAKQRLNAMIENSKIVVIASHDEHVIRSLCNKVIVMEAGQVVYYGDVEAGLARL